MAVNKVVYGDETLIDLTNDTVTSDTLADGVVAHGADGELITGTMATASPVRVYEDAEGTIVVSGSLTEGGGQANSDGWDVLLDETIPEEVSLVQFTNERCIRAISTESEYSRVQVTIMMTEPVGYTADTNEGTLTCGIWCEVNSSSRWYESRFMNAIKCTCPSGVSYIHHSIITIDLRIPYNVTHQSTMSLMRIDAIKCHQNQVFINTLHAINNQHGAGTNCAVLSKDISCYTLKFESSNGFGAGTRFLITGRR